MLLRSDFYLIGALLLGVGCTGAFIMRVRIHRIFFSGLAAAYIIIVLGLTLFPIPYQEAGRFAPAPHNLIPFRTIPARAKRRHFLYFQTSPNKIYLEKIFKAKGENDVFDGLMRLLVRNYGSTDPAVREKSGQVAGGVGIATNLLLFAIKLAAGLLSHSVAIMADAINNLTDSGSSIIMLVGFKLAGKPADQEHPFGHARIEYLCGVIVSFIVLFLGLELGKSSVEKIFSPETAAFGPVTLSILVVSVAMKLWQCLFYRSVGKKIGSQALVATASDSRNDVVATLVVLLGAVVTAASGWHLDGWLGLAVAVFIVVSGVKLVIETANPLLGAAPDQELVGRVYEKIRSYPGIIGIHDLTVHSYGEGRCFASVHCEVPAEEDILVSHDLIDNIERDFLSDEGIHLVIHLDPIVTGDLRTQQLREQVLECVKDVYPQAAIHDFRVVWGVTHSNIVFDAAVPFTLKDSDERVRSNITHRIEELDPAYRVVLTVDREGVVHEMER